MAVTDKALLAANWKMNPTDGGDALDLVKGILPVATSSLDNVEVALFPPFPWLLGVAEALDQTGVKLGAQDCFWEMAGAYTGEVSPATLSGSSTRTSTICPSAMWARSSRQGHR